MSIILSIETSTTNCSVSLSNNGKVLVLKEDYGANYSHAERLHVYIDEVIQKAGLARTQIDAIAVSKGPGSYTGLRIGVSTAKGLCYALQKPLISISTLKSLACQIHEDEGLIVPMIDARRMEVYTAVFDAQYHTVEETQALILDQNAFEAYLNKGKVHFIGNGVAKAKTIIAHSNAIFVDDKLPSANEMALLAYDKFKKNDIEDVAYFEPYYLKDFIAIKPS